MSNAQKMIQAVRDGMSPAEALDEDFEPGADAFIRWQKSAGEAGTFMLVNPNAMKSHGPVRAKYGGGKVPGRAPKARKPVLFFSPKGGGKGGGRKMFSKRYDDDAAAQADVKTLTKNVDKGIPRDTLRNAGFKASNPQQFSNALMGKVREALNEEGGFTLNAATTPLDKARAYFEEVFTKAGKNLDETLPDFDKNYKALQSKLKAAKGVARIDMPVIEPEDMKAFDADLKVGKVDIFAPYAKGHFDAPTNLDKRTGSEWVSLGFKDGEKTDDQVKAKWTSIAGGKLLPAQNQIWLEKLAKNIAKFGPPKSGSPVLSTTIIVSKEGYILDGHHRFGQVMLADPGLKLKSLHIPMDIKTLLKIGRSYGNAIGNQQKG